MSQMSNHPTTPTGQNKLRESHPTCPTPDSAQPRRGSAEQVEVVVAVRVECDELSVELDVRRERGSFRIGNSYEVSLGLRPGLRGQDERSVATGVLHIREGERVAVQVPLVSTCPRRSRLRGALRIRSEDDPVAR